MLHLERKKYCTLNRPFLIEKHNMLLPQICYATMHISDKRNSLDFTQLWAFPNNFLFEAGGGGVGKGWGYPCFGQIIESYMYKFLFCSMFKLDFKFQ